MLLDMQMPVMDGLEAMTLIRAAERGTGRKTPMIALTADVIPEHRQGYIAAGADSVIPKPVDWVILDEEMEHLVVGNRPIPGNAVNMDTSGQTELLDLNMIQELSDTLGRDTLVAMIPSFIESTTTYVADIEAAANANKLRDAKRAAHALKGLCAQFGANYVAAKAKVVEADTSSVEQITAFMPELGSALAATLQAIRERFGLDA